MGSFSATPLQVQCVSPGGLLEEGAAGRCQVTGNVHIRDTAGRLGVTEKVGGLRVDPESYKKKRVPELPLTKRIPLEIWGL